MFPSVKTHFGHIYFFINYEEVSGCSLCRTPTTVDHFAFKLMQVIFENILKRLL